MVEGKIVEVEGKKANHQRKKERKGKEKEKKKNDPSTRQRRQEKHQRSQGQGEQKRREMTIDTREGRMSRLTVFPDMMVWYGGSIKRLLCEEGREKRS